MLIGIDLGTTYSAVSYLDKKGNPQIILNREEEPTTPSVVYVDGEHVIVGKRAREKALSFPEKICKCIKRLMGFKEIAIQDNNTKYTPETISAMIVKRLLEDVLNQQKGFIDGIVVTVPTYFNEIKRTATKQSVEVAIAALKEDSELAEYVKQVAFVAIIDEPKAAALYYSHKMERENGKILIYDLGGGTFDAALVEIADNKVTVIAEGEEHEAGGTFFDEKILKYVMDEIEEKYHVDLRKTEYQNERAKILLEAENCKKKLSQEGVDAVKMTVSMKHKSVDVSIARAGFEEMIEPYVYRTIDTIDEMLYENDIKPSEIDEIVLVGGSSRIPYVRKALKEFFGKELSEAIDPDKAVTYGAAIYAGIRQQECGLYREAEDEKDSVPLMLEDVCAHSIGLLITKNAVTKEKEDHVLIEENTPIVAEAEQEFNTAYAGQTYIKIELTEAGNKFTEQVIKLPESLPKGTKVRIRLRVNQDHLIEVAMHIPDIDFSEEYEVTRINNLSEEEQKEMSGLIASKTLE